MVVGYHIILSAYGFWLPNDPRGSWSDFVGAWELVRFGKATKTNQRRSLAATPHDRTARLRAKRALKYPPVRFDGRQARAIGRGFAGFARKTELTVWACSILPEHVHLVIARHRYPVRQVVSLLKGASTRRMVHENIHPMKSLSTRVGGTPKAWARGHWKVFQAWARGHWKVFLNNPRDVHRAIRYVEQNSMREDLGPQRWSFVSEYEPPRAQKT